MFCYFAAASSVASSVMLEGPTATAYSWNLFFLALFAPDRWVARIAVMAMAVSTFILHEIMSYGMADQFTARNHPAIISIPLGMIILAALRWPALIAPPLSQHAAKSAVILLFLAGAGLGNEVVTIRNWSKYVGIYRQVVVNCTGFVAWGDLMAQLPPDQARVLRRNETAPCLRLSDWLTIEPEL